METGLTVDGGSPARHAGQTATISLKNSEGTQPIPGRSHYHGFLFPFLICLTNRQPVMAGSPGSGVSHTYRESQRRGELSLGYSWARLSQPPRYTARHKGY
jgi:hypothetical protein